MLAPSLMVAGADSTISLASFRPRPVAPRTALITATLLPPTADSTTSNSVFFQQLQLGRSNSNSCSGRNAEFSSIIVISSTTSITDISATASRIWSLVIDITSVLKFRNSLYVKSNEGKGLCSFFLIAQSSRVRTICRQRLLSWLTSGVRLLHRKLGELPDDRYLSLGLTHLQRPQL